MTCLYRQRCKASTSSHQASLEPVLSQSVRQNIPLVLGVKTPGVSLCYATLTATTPFMVPTSTSPLLSVGVANREVTPIGIEVRTVP
jgi:hypothetical protein